MVYTLQCPGGFEWRIADDDHAHRWILWIGRNGRWQKAASYTSPGAAALAVANGDTGETDWDDAPGDCSAYDLSRWARADADEGR